MTSQRDISPPGGPYRDPNDHSELYLTASLLGAGAGFALLYPSMAREAKGREVTSNIEFSVNPLAVAQLAGGSRRPTPLEFLRYRF